MKSTFLIVLMLGLGGCNSEKKSDDATVHLETGKEDVVTEPIAWAPKPYTNCIFRDERGVYIKGRVYRTTTGKYFFKEEDW